MSRDPKTNLKTKPNLVTKIGNQSHTHKILTNSDLAYSPWSRSRSRKHIGMRVMEKNGKFWHLGLRTAWWKRLFIGSLSGLQQFHSSLHIQPSKLSLDHWSFPNEICTIHFLYPLTLFRRFSNSYLSHTFSPQNHSGPWICLENTRMHLHVYWLAHSVKLRWVQEN